MNDKICPRIHGRAFLLTILLLIGSKLGISQNGPANTGSPAAQSQVQLEGELEILHQDFNDGRGHYLYFLKRSDGSRVPLQFMKRPPTHLLTGARVRATGQRSGGSLVLYSGASGSTSLTATSTGPTTSSAIPVPNTIGPQSTLVILVNFQDDPVQPYTVATAQSMFFSTVNNFILENSYGQTSLTGDVVGWFTIPESITTCNMTQIASDAQNAAAASGTNLSNYARYVYMFPYNTVCGFAGSSYVGGSPSQSWINEDVLDAHIVAHELGHAFGLWHSHLLDCGTSASICSNGIVVEYGDPLDVMGVPQTAAPEYNAFQKERLGWLSYGNSPAVQTVQTSGTYNISVYEQAGAGPNALKILKSIDPNSGAKTWYYLEARQAVGADAFLSSSTYYTQNETTGVLFHIGTDGDGNTSDLLDMTPVTSTSTGWLDASLAVAQSFQDSAAGVTITTESVNSGSAVVNIQLAGAGSGTATPSSGNLTVATNQAVYSPGQTVFMTATATSGGAPVANVAVSFAVTKANGTQVTGSAKTGRNGVAVYKLRLKQSDPPGTYIAGANTTIKGKTLNAGTEFTLQ
jgi:hypothetical protein